MAAFAQFGSDLDASTQRLLNRGARLTELLKQPQYQPMPVEEQVAAIYTGVKGYLDMLPVNAVQRFAGDFLRLLRSKNQNLLDSIRTGKQLTPEIEATLKSILDEFSKSFA
jgi:F-type H+-transporting ATPase subunit alpha